MDESDNFVLWRITNRSHDFFYGSD